jgi:phosphoribosylglycinamide formyltransferase-1
MIKITLFASGSGTNVENIIRYFSENKSIKVDSVIYNRKEAGVVQRANKLGIPCFYYPKSKLENGELLDFLQARAVDFIILAGFLLKIPSELIQAFPERILNIHPSLLPKYGGKGMYGAKVHEAVKQNQEKISGITIHLVNEVYDDGRILRQESVELNSDDNAEDIAKKIHTLEYAYFPETIEDYCLKHG